MKSKILIIDHQFHKKTKSSSFLIEELKKNFEIELIFSEHWSPKKYIIDYCNLEKFEYIIFWQILPELKELQKMQKKKIILVPMYDSVGLSKFYWKLLSKHNIKILSFSQKISERCNQNNIYHKNLKFFIKKDDIAPLRENKKKSIFFWYRGDISFQDIKKIIKPEDVEKVTYRVSLDPGKTEESITEEDKKKYNIEIIKNENFISKNDYIKMLRGHDIFISPRKREGIGMSFLEAMSNGLVVVAYNDGTMNEYIINKINGYLFKNNSDNIDLNNFKTVRKESIKTVENGWSKWNEEKNTITSFIQSGWTNKSIGFFINLEILIFYFFRKVKNILK